MNRSFGRAFSLLFVLAGAVALIVYDVTPLLTYVGFFLTPYTLYALYIQFIPVGKANVHVIQHVERDRTVHLTATIERDRRLFLPFIQCTYQIVRKGSDERLTHREWRWLGRSKRWTVTIQTPPLERGTYEWQSVECRIQDTLQFANRTVHLGECRLFYMYPLIRPYDVSTHSYGEHGLPSSSESVHVDASGIDLATIRPYVPGDTLAQIDWKSSAKKNELMTKLFERDESTRLMIQVDTRESAYFEERLEFAMTLGTKLYERSQSFAYVANERVHLVESRASYAAYCQFLAVCQPSSKRPKPNAHAWFITDDRVDAPLFLSKGRHIVLTSHRHPSTSRVLYVPVIERGGEAE